MFRRVLYFLRELLAEWAYGLTLPFRAFGPHVLRSEITRDARAALTGGGDVFRAARVGLWTVGVFFVRLPRLIIAFPGAVWWFLRTRHPIHLLLGSAMVIGVGVAVGLPSVRMLREWQSETHLTVIWRTMIQHLLH